MKLLLFSDLHADAEAARRLIEGTQTADVLVGAGDFGNVRRDVRVVIDVLRQVGKPAVLVAGNNELGPIRLGGWRGPCGLDGLSGHNRDNRAHFGAMLPTLE